MNRFFTDVGELRRIEGSDRIDKDYYGNPISTPLISAHGGEYLSDDEIYEEETEDKANTRWDTHLSPNDRPSLTRMFVDLIKAMPLEGAMTSVMQRALKDGWDLARTQGLEDLVNKPAFWTGFEKLMKEPMEFYARRAIVRAASRHKQLGVKPTDIADIANKAAKKFTKQWYSHIRNATAGKMYDLKDVAEPELSQRAFTLFNRDRAERIAANEASKLNDIGNLLVYQVAGIDEEFWSTEKDAKVDDICKQLSGRRFKMGEGPRPITDTHIGCRCERLPILSMSKAVQQEAVGPNAGKGEVIFGEDPDPEMAAHDMAGKGANDWIKTVHKQGPPRPGLVPQSGDPEHPVRWIKPKGDNVEKPKAKSAFKYHEEYSKEEEIKASRTLGFDVGQFLEEAYQFSIPEYGITATSVMNLTGIRKKEVLITMNIVGPDEEIVGELERLFYKNEAGNLTIYHEFFEIEEKFQGKGLATDLNEQAEKVYMEHGVQAIKLSANLNIGGYAWARQGYDFLNEEELHRHLDELQYKAEEGLKLEDMSDEQIEIEMEMFMELEHAWDIAGWNPTNAESGKHLGKWLLLGYGWNGRKTLDSNHKSFQIGEAYRKAKKRIKNAG